MNKTELANSLKGLVFFPVFVLLSYSSAYDGLFTSALQLFSFVAIILPFALFGFLSFLLNTICIISYLVISTKLGQASFSIIDTLNVVIYVCCAFAIFIMCNLGRKRLNISFFAPILAFVLLVFFTMVSIYASNTGSVATDLVNYLEKHLNAQVVDIINLNNDSGITKKDFINVFVMFFPSFFIVSVTVISLISYHIAFIVASYINKKVKKDKYELNSKANYIYNAGFLAFGVMAILVNKVLPSSDTTLQISNFKYFVYTTTISYLILYIIPGLVVFINIIKKSMIYILITVIIALFFNMVLVIPIIILGVLQSFGVLKSIKN